MPAYQYVYHLDGLTKIYPGGKKVFENIRLHFLPDAKIGVVGVNGSGKSTLLRIMAGLDHDIIGEAKPAEGIKVGYLPQEPKLDPSMTVFENIASPLRVARVADAEVRRRVGRIAELLQLGPFLERRPAELSGGQQQRTALARALVKEAALVLLDEPLANLDYKLREGLRDELPRLFADRACTVVYATTEPSEALLLGGHTAVLHEGRVLQYGPAAAVYREPADLATARAYSDPPINVAQVEKRGSRIVLSPEVGWDGGPRAGALADGTYIFGLRPHHVLPRTDAASGGVPVEGTVLISEISGSESVIHFALGGLTWVSLSRGVHGLKVGSRARFELDVARGLYFAPDGPRVAG